MPTNQECVCCCEAETVANKFQESERVIGYITDHEGFEPVCLDVWVLQTAYYQYRQRYGEAEEKSIHMQYCLMMCISHYVSSMNRRYRFIAYRQLVLGVAREDSSRCLAKLCSDEDQSILSIGKLCWV